MADGSNLRLFGPDGEPLGREQVAEPRADAVLDEATVHAWLIDHYSHKVKLSQPRIATLLGLRDAYPFLRAPSTETIYRGLANVSPAVAGKLVGSSDPARDKSWTTSPEQAVKFARGEYIRPDAIASEKIGVVMHARVDPDRLLLDAVAIAGIPAIADAMHPIWNEPLGPAIMTEREVVVLGPAEVERVEVLPMPRMDRGPNSAAIMLPIPPDLAAAFPDNGKSMPPHVTMLYVPELDPSKVDELAVIVADELGVRWSTLGCGDLEDDVPSPSLRDVQALALGGLNYFDKDDGRVAFADVSVPPALRAIRESIGARLARVGIELARKGEPWVPHATLAYLPPGEVYTGSVPSGTWTASTLEVWARNGTLRYVIGYGSVSGVDKYELVGSRWAAFRDGGRVRVGDFDSETEARAGLAADAVTRCLQNRYDARPDDEKADIRERWNGPDGPNMGPERMREWLDSPFSGPNRKEGADRERARRVADRALRLIGKPQGEWTEADYSGAAQVLAYIARAKEIEQGEPLVIDGREGPSARDAALRDWAYDPKADAPAPRSDKRPLAPAVHTESRAHTTDIIRADRVEIPTEHKPVYHPDGWVLYPVLYSRGGNIQDYEGVREFRPWSEVSSRVSMDSGIGNPWELRHSRDLLNPDTVRGVARGCIVSIDPYHDNQHTFGWAKAWDRALLYAIEGVDGERPEAPEVSVAYRGRVHRQPGHDDYGNPFDQWISDLIWNSLASEPFGRAETARVLGVRADAADAITVHGADELLALARGSRSPTRPIYYDLSSWTRFDSARPTHVPRKDMTNKALIKAASALGVAEDAIAKALGLSTDDLKSLLASDTELTPDQVNALLAVLPADPKAAEPVSAPPKMEEMEDKGEPPPMGKVMIEGVEHSVPKAVADLVTMLEGRADRAGKRAEKLDGELARTEKELAIAKDESTKRADAMGKMVSRADAEKMVQSQAQHIAGAMELARRSHGNEWMPEPRKDSSSGEVLPLSATDWEMAAIRSAFGAKADAIISRIDAAPTPEARAYAVRERLADAREILDRRDHKDDQARSAIEKMRRRNAEDDKARQDGESDDELAAAREARLDRAETQYVGAPTQTNGVT